jgi:hypothetical protein
MGTILPSRPYEQQFIARIPMPRLFRVWKTKGESKVKFFIWTLIQNRLWTADRLQRRGWEHQASCCACDQVLESASHLILGCPFAKEVWHLMANQFKDAAAAALQATSINIWWDKTFKLKRKGTPVDECTVAIYVAWNLWNERNRRIFKQERRTAAGVCSLIREELGLLKEAWVLLFRQDAFDISGLVFALLFW